MTARVTVGPSEEERLARAALSRLGEPGDLRLTRLVDELGGSAVYDALTQGSGPDALRRDLAERFDEIDAEQDLERAAQQGIRFVIPGDDEWPGSLHDLAYAEPLQSRGGVPIGLWVKGVERLHRLDAGVAVVGSRSSTSYGTQIALDLGAELAEAGHTVISGAAFGIDDAAHRGALAVDRPTVAVMACGVDRPYPAAHKELLAYIAAHGAVVSEAAPGCAPLQVRFLARNRLIAALSEGTVVVEAARRSGALNTANWASRLQRPLMGVPGPVTSASSSGVHELIRRAEATLVTGAPEVLELIAPAGEHLPPEPSIQQNTARDRMEPRHRQVLDAVPVMKPAALASIARTAGVARTETERSLSWLVAAGLVHRDPQGWRLQPADGAPRT